MVAEAGPLADPAASTPIGDGAAVAAAAAAAVAVPGGEGGACLEPRPLLPSWPLTAPWGCPAPLGWPVPGACSAACACHRGNRRGVAPWTAAQRPSDPPCCHAGCLARQQTPQWRCALSCLVPHPCRYHPQTAPPRFHTSCAGPACDRAALPPHARSEKWQTRHSSKHTRRAAAQRRSTAARGRKGGILLAQKGQWVTMPQHGCCCHQHVQCPSGVSWTAGSPRRCWCCSTPLCSQAACHY